MTNVWTDEQILLNEIADFILFMLAQNNHKFDGKMVAEMAGKRFTFREDGDRVLLSASKWIVFLGLDGERQNGIHGGTRNKGYIGVYSFPSSQHKMTKKKGKWSNNHRVWLYFDSVMNQEAFEQDWALVRMFKSEWEPEV